MIPKGYITELKIGDKIKIRYGFSKIYNATVINHFYLAQTIELKIHKGLFYEKRLYDYSALQQVILEKQ